MAIRITDDYGRRLEGAPMKAPFEGLVALAYWCNRTDAPSPEVTFFATLSEAAAYLGGEPLYARGLDVWTVDCTQPGCVRSSALLKAVHRGDPIPQGWHPGDEPRARREARCAALYEEQDRLLSRRLTH